MKAYKLSPSDFAYLYQECKHCYYRKIRMGFARPKMPFPGIFTAINSRLQGALVGNDLRTLSADLPEGVVIKQEGFVRSQVVPDTEVFLSGKYDILVQKPDGTHLLIDFKLSEPKEEKIELYKTQLYAYKFALENPQTGEPLMVNQMGLIVMYPDTVKFENGRAILDFPPRFLEIPVDSDGFMNFIGEVNKLLTGPLPSKSLSCPWCQYQQIEEDLTEF
ncbi:MAG TPA: PD-(D/E)XK nuclease family protein [Patescibacteria group bacterium]|nr:PD-(D/E)XK nuclease family protein [Patescibacteria group bacterium]